MTFPPSVAQINTWDAEVAETDVSAATVATDVIFDAKGDLAVGTGADAAAKLTAGANGTVPTYQSAQTTGILPQYPPGYEFDYVTQANNLTVTATSAATAQAMVTGNAKSFDGSTRVKLEFYTALIQVDSSATIVPELYDGVTDTQLRLGQLTGDAQANGPFYLVYFLTPSNGSHTYSIRFWKTGGSASVAGTSSGLFVPCFYRLTMA